MDKTDFLRSIRALALEYDMLPRNATVLIALSGGRDSMALCHALLALRKELGFSLSAAHLNHGLRGAESARDAAFVADYCQTVGLPLLQSSVDVAALATAQKRGIEETAREARYAFLEESAAAYSATRIATAHHADDNLETLLLHLLRGAGLRGLAGIPPIRGCIVRPMLHCTRADIDAYLAEEGIPYVEDSSNADEAMRRNQLRHSIVPQLRAHNPKITESVCQLQETLRADEACLTASAMRYYREARHAEDGMVIPVSVLAGLPRALAVRVLRRMLEEIEAAMPGHKHFEAMLALLHSPDPTGALHLPGGILVQRIYGDLLLCWDHLHEPAPVPPPLVPKAEGSVDWGDYVVSLSRRPVPPEAAWTPYSAYLRVEAGDLLLRGRATGDLLALPRRRTKRIKKWMIEEKIPRRDRDSLPILATGNTVVFAAGLGPASGAVANPGEMAHYIEIVRRRNSHEPGS